MYGGTLPAQLMDNLRAGARELAEQSLEKAYADVLENYLTYSASGGDVQKVFATRYMDGLQKQFAEGILVKTQLVTKIVIKF